MADTVIAMDCYRARDVTSEAKAVAERMPTGRIIEGRARRLHPLGPDSPGQ